LRRLTVLGLGDRQRAAAQVAKRCLALAPDTKKVDLGFGDPPGDFMEFWAGVAGNLVRQCLNFATQLGIGKDRDAEAVTISVAGGFCPPRCGLRAGAAQAVGAVRAALAHAGHWAASIAGAC
jgi:hypothetical protein